MLENMVTSLLHHQQITTTLPKAKAAQRLAERVISLGKRDSLASRRMAFSYLQDHTLTSKLFKDVAPRFKNRNGGYTRILHLQRRKGDGAELALLELTEKEIKIKEAKPRSKKDSKDDKHKHLPGSPAGKHEGHEHKDEGTETKHELPKSKSKENKPTKTGFFRNVSKFFRNKGGG
jgi:large subunit ribosomal protein L17